MAYIPDDIVRRIYDATDILEVVGEYVQLKKRGANYWALSPFVNEKTPSFAVNPVKGIFKDFSSGKGGDAIKFLMEMEGYGYVEALRHLARKYNIEIPETEETPEQAIRRDKRESLLIVNEFAAKFFESQLLDTEAGRAVGLSYFRERGILEATLGEFRLGYSPDQWDALAQEALRQQFNEEYLLELGLVSRSEKTGKLVDRFRDRVMFPIQNAAGKVVGFGGRILGNRKDTGKYINSSESEIYHKSEILYGLYQARNAIRNEDLCILTEGYMDVILLHQNGIRHVVASSGTALTPEQIRLIRRYTKRVLLIYDGDAAGIKAALRGIDLLVKAGMEARIVALPDNHDPDSYVRLAGAEGFRSFIQANAQDFADFKLNLLLAGGASGPQADADRLQQMAGTLALLPERVQRELYVRHVAQRLGVSEGLMAHAVEEAMKEAARHDRPREPRESPDAQPGVPPPAEVKELKTFEQLELVQQEKELLRVILSHHDKQFAAETGPSEDAAGQPIRYPERSLMEFMMTELEGLVFENQVFEQLKNELFAEYAAHQSLRVAPYLSHADAGLSNLVAGLLTTPDISPLWKKMREAVDYDGDLRRVVMGAVFHYKARKVEVLLRDCRAKLQAASAAKDGAEEDLWLETFQYLMQLRRELHQKLGVEGAVSGSDGRL
jgi:DNA primase